MALSINTDYVTGTGNPEPYLRRIGEAGFTHVHWCHQWCTDFIYAPSEVGQIRKWLDACGLKLLDLHASSGVEKYWTAPAEYARRAGVELVGNRIDMTADLGGDAIVMHAQAPKERPEVFRAQVRRSLDELEPHARARGVRIAIENVGPWAEIVALLAEYSPEFLGVCYDSGHGNLNWGGCGPEEMAAARDRLIALHLNDNDGSGDDQHKPLFMGTVPWQRVAEIIADSAYTKHLNSEVSIRQTGITEEPVFLARSFEASTRFSRMIEARRKELAASAAGKPAQPRPSRGTR